MKINMKLMSGIASATYGWDIQREEMFEWCCRKGKERWKDERFREHMRRLYFGPGSEPVTIRMDQLEEHNRVLIPRYLYEAGHPGLALTVVEF